MNEQQLLSLRYPIGKYLVPSPISEQHITRWIQDIEGFPDQVVELVRNLAPEQQRSRYRPGGWTLTQLVHHCADSHLNSIIRFKWALTEETPLIKAYDEGRWAELPDSRQEDLNAVLQLLQGLHKRWVDLLKKLTPEQLQRSFIHPESGNKITLAENIGNYAWHCRHHLAHMQLALEANGKYNTEE